MIRQLTLFVRLPAPDRRALLEAVTFSTLAAILVHTVQFRRLTRRLGHHMAVSGTEIDTDRRAQVALVCWAIDAAERHLPWHPVCLPRAIAAQWMLRRRQIPSTLYLGADPARDYDAHAWVRAGRTVVTGGPLDDRYKVVSTFA